MTEAVVADRTYDQSPETDVLPGADDQECRLSGLAHEDTSGLSANDQQPPVRSRLDRVEELGDALGVTGLHRQVGAVDQPLQALTRGLRPQQRVDDMHRPQGTSVPPG